MSATVRKRAFGPTMRLGDAIFPIADTSLVKHPQATEVLVLKQNLKQKKQIA